jgi:hypothetical protein
MTSRYSKKMETYLEKNDIVWKHPFGYVFNSTDDGEYAKMCKVIDVELVIDKLLD